MTDIRPANCRFRLQDEGKSYPRSSCQACGKNIMSGLGKSCTVAQDQRPASFPPFKTGTPEKIAADAEARRKLPHEVNEFLQMLIAGPQLGKTYMNELNRFSTKARWVKVNFQESELPEDVKQLVTSVSTGPEWGTSINHSLNLYAKTAIQLRSNYSGKSQKVAPLEPEPIWNGESAMNKENVDTLKLGMDAVKWAQEFNRVSSRLGYSKMDEAWLIGWFANAIMSGYDTARNRYDPEAIAALNAALGVDEPAKPE